MLAKVVFVLRRDVAALEVLVLVDAGHDAANAKLLLSLRMVLGRNKRRGTVDARGEKGNGECSGSSKFDRLDQKSQQGSSVGIYREMERRRGADRTNETPAKVMPV